MASARLPVLRHRLESCVRPLGHVQRRWAQVQDVRFLATHQPPVQDRYKQKLEQKAAREGHDSISSLKEAYQDKIKDVQDKEASRQSIPKPDQDTAVPPPSSNTPGSTTGPATAASQPPPKSNSAVPGIKPLSSYLDLEKIKTLPPKEIEGLWRLRHANNSNSVCAAIPLEVYNRIIKTARQHPQFILPLPREVEVPKSTTQEGERDSSSSSSSSSSGETTTTTAAEMHFLQWGFHPPASLSSSSPPPPPQSAEAPVAGTANTHTSTVIFTHLAQYKLHGTYSEPHTIITHHLDLADSAGLVLMNGSVVPDRGVSVNESKLLLMWLQRFYDWGSDGQKGGKKAEMLQMFSRGDVEGFKIGDLVEEVEKV